MTNEKHPLVDEQVRRPLSPHYLELKQLLEEADVLLVPTDRDLAPTDNHNDDPESA